MLSPRGRISRQTFFTAVAGLVAANVILGMVPLFGPILVLPLLWPFACVTAKRLHDASRSAWPVAIVTTLALGTGLFAAAIGLLSADPSMALSAFAVAGVALLLGGLTTVFALAVLLWAGLSSSDPQTNWFGAAEASPLSLRM